MIEAKELRMRNWVSYHGIPTKVDSYIGKTTVRLPINESDNIDVEPETLYQNIDPIMLTPEVIKKIAFTHVYSSDEFDINMKDRRFLGRRSGNQHCFGMFHEGISIGTVYTIHALQNLIFSITGNEMEIDLLVTDRIT
jgi:hypothetical protein